MFNVLLLITGPLSEEKKSLIFFPPIKIVVCKIHEQENLHVYFMYPVT